MKFNSKETLGHASRQGRSILEESDCLAIASLHKRARNCLGALLSNKEA